MKRFIIYRYIGGYKLSATYTLADFLKRSEKEYPCYCRITFMRHNSKFRSLALPDKYRSISQVSKYEALLSEEVENIASLIKNFPDDGTNLAKRGVNLYLNNQSPFRGRIKDLRSAYDNLRNGLLTEEPVRELLVDFNRKVLEIKKNLNQ